MMIYFLLFLLLNITCSFVGIATIQNEEEGGDFLTLLSLIALGLFAGAPLFAFLIASDVIGYFYDK